MPTNPCLTHIQHAQTDVDHDALSVLLTFDTKLAFLQFLVELEENKPRRTRRAKRRTRRAPSVIHTAPGAVHAPKTLPLDVKPNTQRWRVLSTVHAASPNYLSAATLKRNLPDVTANTIGGRLTELWQMGAIERSEHPVTSTGGYGYRVTDKGADVIRAKNPPTLDNTTKGAK